jgi:DNA repair exonuclease SbcCD ATPase subunit
MGIGDALSSLTGSGDEEEEPAEEVDREMEEIRDEVKGASDLEAPIADDETIEPPEDAGLEELDEHLDSAGDWERTDGPELTGGAEPDPDLSAEPGSELPGEPGESAGADVESPLKDEAGGSPQENEQGLSGEEPGSEPEGGAEELIEEIKEVEHQLEEVEHASSEARQAVEETDEESDAAASPENGADEEQPVPEATEPAAGDDAEEPVQKGLEQRVRELEQEIVENDSEQLGKVNELEKRIEQLELEETQMATMSEFRDFREEMLNRLESFEAPESLDNRLTELEDDVAELSRRIGEDSETDVDQLQSTVEQLQDEIKQLRGTVSSKSSEFEERFEKLENAETREIDLEDRVKALNSRIENLEDSASPGVSKDVEELWEAVDEETARLEQELQENRETTEDLKHKVVQLSELVKRGLQ